MGAPGPYTEGRSDRQARGEVHAVAGPVPFTDNYRDHSTEAGFQFEFFCERCGNGYKSGFKANPLGMGAKVMRGLGGLLGGRLGNAQYGTDQLRDMTESQSKDKALAEAVENVAPQFEQELGQMQSQARLEQAQEKVKTVDWLTDVNVERKQRAMCPHCGAEASASGKFCENCGKPLTIPVTCAKCGTESERGTKFCPECGNNLLVQA